MGEINFALLQPVDTGAQAMQGFQTGMAMVKQVQTKHALSNYLTNPDDPQAYNALAYYDPPAASTIQNQRLQQRKLLIDQQDRERQVALGGLYNADPQAARTAAIDAGDFDLAAKFGELGDADRKRAAEFWKDAGPVAYRLKQTKDPAERQALWAQARPILEANGAEASLLDKFDPTNDTQLDAAITTSQTVAQLIDQGKITWHQQGEQPSFATDSMGQPVGSQNPYAKGDSYGGPQGKLSAAQAWQFIAPHEGGYAAHDGNGSPVNFGINQGANPDVDVGKLTADKAQKLFEDRYWKPSGADALPAPLAAVHADTYFINPGKAAEFLKASDGNPARYMDLREQWLSSLAAQPKYQRFAKAWSDRNDDLREFSAEVGGGHGASSAVPTVSNRAEMDALPSGTVFMAPDGSRRVKP